MKRITSILLSLILAFSLLSCTAVKNEKQSNSLDEAEEAFESDTYTLKTDEPSDVTKEIKEETEMTEEIIEEVTESEKTDAVINDKPSVDDTEALPLSGRNICVDAGHGSFSQSYQEAIGPGSSQTKPAFVSGTSGSYQSEAEFNLKVALMLESLLVEQGATVFMTRTDENATLSNIGRAELANDNNCDIAVRIHADGSTDPSVHGVSMLVPASNEFIADSKLLSDSYSAGESVLNAVIESTGAVNRGIIYRNDLTGFNWSTVPSILIECGYMSNTSDDAKLADPEYQMLIAKGICHGLIEYFNNNL